MAMTYGKQMALLVAANPPEKADVTFVGARVRAFNEQVVYSAQASGATITVARLPKGAVPIGVTLTTDTSTSTAQIAVGNATTADAYGAAAVYTTVDTPVTVMKQAPSATVLSDQTDIILTVSVAALPASGNLSVRTEYLLD